MQNIIQRERVVGIIITVGRPDKINDFGWVSCSVLLCTCDSTLHVRFYLAPLINFTGVSTELKCSILQWS